MKKPEDSEIIKNFLQGGQKAEYAFQQIVQLYGELIFKQIYRMIRNQDHSKDVLQNVLIKIWSNLGSFKEESALYTWIYRITRNETLSFMKREKLRTTLSLDGPIVHIIPGCSELEGVSPEKISELLMLAIDQLPEKQALVFNLKYFEELKYSEISNRTGTSEGALKASYHLAVQKIQEFLMSQLNL